MDNKEDLNNIDDSDTLYFGDDRNYEKHTNPPYTEEEMYQDYRPMTNINSVEYDENDYEATHYDDEDEEDNNSRTKLTIAYIVAIILFIIFIFITFVK